MGALGTAIPSLVLSLPLPYNIMSPFKILHKYHNSIPNLEQYLAQNIHSINICLKNEAFHKYFLLNLFY